MDNEYTKGNGNLSFTEIIYRVSILPFIFCTTSEKEFPAKETLAPEPDERESESGF